MSSFENFVSWWERIVYVALCLSIALVGIGPSDAVYETAGVSAWSVSRTTFFFWLIGKFMTWARHGRPKLGLDTVPIPLPVLVFFSLVTISLLPDFHNTGDYRYFFFGSMHYLMILDVFSKPERSRLAYLLLALLPGVLLVRGLWHDPSVLGATDMRRFGYPLPHPNIAGYLFAMSLPLCAAVAFAERGRLRCLSIIAGSAQLLALALTYSRGSWLGFLISIICLGVALKRKAVGIILGLIAIAFSVATPLRDRVISLLQPRTDVAISERLESIEAGLRVGLEYPILGVGYGRGRLREGLRELYGDEPGGIHRIAHTHNLYVELFAATGSLGLGSLLWLLAQAVYQTVAMARRLDGAGRVYQFGIAASLVAFAATGFGDVPFYHHSVRILFFTLLALAHLGCRNIDSARNGL